MQFISAFLEPVMLRRTQCVAFWGYFHAKEIISISITIPQPSSFYLLNIFTVISASVKSGGKNPAFSLLEILFKFEGQKSEKLLAETLSKRQKCVCSETEGGGWGRNLDFYDNSIVDSPPPKVPIFSGIVISALESSECVEYREAGSTALNWNK